RLLRPRRRPPVPRRAQHRARRAAGRGHRAAPRHVLHGRADDQSRPPAREGALRRLDRGDARPLALRPVRAYRRGDRGRRRNLHAVPARARPPAAVGRPAALSHYRIELIGSYDRRPRESGDKRNFGIKLGRSLTSNAMRPLVVALDNVDRRESAQQLQIFKAAQWFRRETHAFTLLPLRDVTFERFKDQPPLDAFAQISNFYIRPPRFALVLQKRLRLAIDVGLQEVATVEQTASSGMRFRYNKDQL